MGDRIIENSRCALFIISFPLEFRLDEVPEEGRMFFFPSESRLPVPTKSPRCTISFLSEFHLDEVPSGGLYGFFPSEFHLLVPAKSLSYVFFSVRIPPSNPNDSPPSNPTRQMPTVPRMQVSLRPEQWDLHSGWSVLISIPFCPNIFAIFVHYSHAAGRCSCSNGRVHSPRCRRRFYQNMKRMTGECF